MEKGMAYFVINKKGHGNRIQPSNNVRHIQEKCMYRIVSQNNQGEKNDLTKGLFHTQDTKAAT